MGDQQADQTNTSAAPMLAYQALIISILSSFMIIYRIWF